jgi:hypothetical protein
MFGESRIEIYEMLGIPRRFTFGTKHLVTHDSQDLPQGHRGSLF